MEMENQIDKCQKFQLPMIPAPRGNKYRMTGTGPDRDVHGNFG